MYAAFTEANPFKFEFDWIFPYKVDYYSAQRKSQESTEWNIIKAYDTTQETSERRKKNL